MQLNKKKSNILASYLEHAKWQNLKQDYNKDVSNTCHFSVSRCISYMLVHTKRKSRWEELESKWGPDVD